MKIEERVSRLEQAMDADSEFLLLVIAAVGCNPEKMGPEREIRYEPTGYQALRGDRDWPLLPGESAEALKARVERELRAEGHKVFVVREMYDEE